MNISVVNVEYNSKFTIKDSERKNTGIYKIVAENEHGRDEAEVEVVILCKFWEHARPGQAYEQMLPIGIFEY